MTATIVGALGALGPAGCSVQLDVLVQESDTTEVAEAGAESQGGTTAMEGTGAPEPSGDMLDTSGSGGPSEDGLVFRSGFEASTMEELNGQPPRLRDLVGSDDSVAAPNRWDLDLEGAGRQFGFNYVDHFDGVNPELLGAYIDADPDDPDNRVLVTWTASGELQESGFWSRVQGELSGLDWPEAYYKVRLRLSADIQGMELAPHEDERTTIPLVDFGSDGEGGSMLLRVLLDRNVPFTQWRDNPTFQWWIEVGQSGGEGEGHVLVAANPDVPVVYDVWQTLEFYVRSGDAATGRVWVALDGVVLFDEVVQTQHPTRPEGVIQRMGILKLQPGEAAQAIADQGGMARIWYDDLELWSAAPVGLGS